MSAPCSRLAGLCAALGIACGGASPAAEHLRLASHGHELHATFEPTGVRIHDGEPGGATLAAVRLASAGRGSALGAVAPGEVVATPGRIEIRRPGLVEWYAKAPEGLEQGFTIEAPPPGDAGELVLELAVEEATVLAAGDDVLLVSPVGLRLRYGSLAVHDATGRSRPARLEARADDRIRLLVADEGAVYPIVVDPLLTAVADTRVDSTQAGADLGRSAAGADLNGDGYADLAIGAPLWDGGQLDEGAVFVFYGGPAGLPSSTEADADRILQADQAGARFGWSVAAAGDVNGDGFGDLLVGAPRYDSGEVDEGAAFLFHGGPAGLVGSGPATAAARIESEQAGAELGRSVAGAGDTDGDGYADVLVGAELYDGGELDEGAAFLFSGSAAGVTGGGPGAATAWLEPDQAGARFGASVAGAGDVDGDGHADLAVGAPGLDAGQSDEGAAFLYRGGAAGLAPGAPARIESDQGGAGLGSAVAGAGDANGDGYADLLVGAPGYDAGELEEGSVFFFPGGAAGIAGGSAAGAARIEANQAGAGLGSALAGAGDVNGDGYADVLLVATLYDAPSSGEGAAWLFAGSAAGLPAGGLGPALVRLEGNQVGAELAAAAAAGDVDGDGYADVLVGVPRFDGPGSVADGGLALLFRGANAGIPSAGVASAATIFTGVVEFDQVGWSVAGAGDVNGDGYGDVIVGAPGYDAGQGRASAAVILYGGPAGIPDGTPATAPTVLQPDPGPASFGWSVAGAGDVNGDGYADVIVGAPFQVTGVQQEGAAYLFLGGPGGIPSFAPPSARLIGDEPNARLGSAVAGAGDLNGDGYADVVVGAPLSPSGGLALVFHGGADGIADGGLATAATRIESDFGDALLGGSVDGAGDVNGDGYGDLIVGARNYAFGGRAFVFHGGPAGIADGTPAAAASVLGPATSNFGASVAGAGDIDGDGYADVLVGAPTTSFIEGRAYLFAGGPAGVSTSPTTTFDTNAFGLGQCVAGAGDLNGDGYGDLALGAYHFTGPEQSEGAVFVYTGGPSGPSFFNTRLETNLASALLGWSCDGAGDVNGDGFADLIASGYPYQRTGGAFVFQGNAGGTGRAVLARQARGDASGLPVEPWGASLDEASFEVRMAATHPEGRGRVRLELEWCPPGVPFGDAGCGAALTPGWTDSGAAAGGAPLSYRVEGLTPGELYRWRARVLYAPFSVTQPGVVPPGVPPRGPWRRVAAAAEPADVRVGVPAPGCSDGRDGDLDGLVDGDDPGCSGPSDATERDPGLPCDNGLDDDSDLRRDFPADAGCLSPLDPSEREASRVCDDGLDNDGDGATDFPADSGCRTGDDASEQPDCSDGLDNDLDGLADAGADPGCSGATDGWERNADVDCDDGVDNDEDGWTDFSTDPEVHDPGCPSPTYYHENPACQDGRDNDGDYWVDFDAGASANGGVPVTEYRDPHCKTPWQEYETGVNQCGLGFELAPLLLALEALRRRRRHPPVVVRNLESAR